MVLVLLRIIPIPPYAPRSLRASRSGQLENRNTIQVPSVFQSELLHLLNCHSIVIHVISVTGRCSVKIIANSPIIYERPRGMCDGRLILQQNKTKKNGQGYAPLSVKPQGAGVGHVVGILTFSEKMS